MINNDRKYVEKCIKKAQGRLNLVAFVSVLITSLIISGAALVLFQAIAFFTVVQRLWIYDLIIPFIGILTAAVYWFFHRVTMKQAAMKLDEKGLKERCITALELLEDESPLADMQIADTKDALVKKEANGELVFKLQPDKMRTALAFLMLSAGILFTFVPSPARETAKELRSLLPVSSS